jgi:importin subunit alpha-1
LINASGTERLEILNIFIQENYIKNYLLVMTKYSNRPEIKAQLLWHFGNLISKNITARDEIIKYNIFGIVYENLQKELINEDVVKSSIWFFSSCTTSKPFPHDSICEKIVDTFLLFMKTQDVELINDCLWGLSKMSESESPEILNKFIHPGVIDYLLGLDYSRQITSIPVIRIFGNLLASTPDLVDSLINAGCINFLEKFIFNKHSQIKRESLWAISNIAAGTKGQVLTLVKSGLLTKIYLLVRDPDLDVVQECAWIIGNCIGNGDLEVCLKLLETKVIDCILEALSNNKTPFVIKLLLTALEKLFEHGSNIQFRKDYNPFINLFTNRGGVDVVSSLQFSKNEDVSDLACRLVDNFGLR